MKELEQLLQSLEAQRRMRKNEEVGSSATPDYGMSSSTEEANCVNEVQAEKKSEEAAIEVTVIQTHVNLKIQCRRRPGQLIKAIVALEELRLTILHLNITSSGASILYSFNLKVSLMSFHFIFFYVVNSLKWKSSQCTVLLTCNLSKT